MSTGEATAGRETTGEAMVSPWAIRKIVLDQSKRAHVGHIGSALSIVEIIAALYMKVLCIEGPADPERDRFILSKGHAALALYAALHLRGWISAADLDTFCGDDSLLGTHPEHSLPGIDFSTGSLGQGLSMAAGAALAARIQGSDRQVYALLSDAECNEGSSWEAVMFAAHHKLANLTAVIDLNGQQALGYTTDVLDLSPMRGRLEAFGWDVVDVDGHDVEALTAAMERREKPGDSPRAIIAHTTFGKGVSYMENKIKWHYWPMSDEEYQQALDEIGAFS